MRNWPSRLESTSTVIFVEVFWAETKAPSKGWPSGPFTVPLTVAATASGVSANDKASDATNFAAGRIRTSTPSIRAARHISADFRKILCRAKPHYDGRRLETQKG